MLTFWQALKTERNIRLINNLFVGLVVLLLFNFLAGRDWGENVVNLAFDNLQQREAKLASRQTPATPVRFIDITEQDHQAWGSPLLTPRRALAGLIERAARQGAKIIVLDILLQGTDCCDPEGDRLLRSTLGRLASSPGAPALIVPVAINRKGVRSASIIDDLIDAQPAGHRVIYRGIPLVSGSSRDRRSRYWEFYRTATSPGQERTILWGVPLLTAALAAGQPQLLDRAEKALLRGERPELDLGKSVYHLPAIDESQIPDLYSQRIRFLLLPPTPGGYRSNLLTVRRSAALMLDHDIDGREFADTIVVIGNSHDDSGDLHDTAVGSLPGMYVIGNAIHTIVAKAQPVPLGRWVVILIEALAIVLMAGIMTIDIPFYIVLPLFVFALPMLSKEINWQLYRHFGIFLNLSTPLTFMGVYRTWSKLLNSLFRKKEKRPKEEVGKDGQDTKTSA